MSLANVDFFILVIVKQILHELHHALGGVFACVTGVSKKTAHDVNRDLKTQLGHVFKL